MLKRVGDPDWGGSTGWSQFSAWRAAGFGGCHVILSSGRRCGALVEHRGARADAKAVDGHWNEQLAAGRDMLWSPTIRAALLANTPWLDVFCPGCGTSKAVDLRTIDRHPLASVGTLHPAALRRAICNFRDRQQCQRSRYPI